MRIISGTYKGKSIIAPKTLPVRPTTDFAKEALFNIIENQFDIDNLSVLDLFAGTGNITYEFASRRAKSIVTVDLHYACTSFIKKTIYQLKFNNVHIIKNDVFKYTKQCKQSFDLIFADPPYDLKNLKEIPTAIFQQELLSPNGWLIVEHDKRTDFKEHPNFFEHRKYGNVNFSFFKNLSE